MHIRSQSRHRLPTLETERHNLAPEHANGRQKIRFQIALRQKCTEDL